MAVTIDIQALNHTKDGWESAIGTAAQSAKKIESGVQGAQASITSTADKIGHTGEVASKMAINLLQAFGLSGEKAKVLESILRQVDDGFDALGKAAHLASVANTVAAASNVAVGTTATGAAVGVRGLTAALIANPITATLVAIAAAAAAVYVAFQSWNDSKDSVEGVNKALEKELQWIKLLIDSTRDRVKSADTLNRLETEAAQKAEIKLIKESTNIKNLKEQLKVSAELADEAIKRERILNRETEQLAEQVEEYKKILAERKKQGEDSGDLGAELIETSRELEKGLEKQSKLKKEIANFEEQARAAQDRILEVPKELLKIEEEYQNAILERYEEIKKEDAKALERQKTKLTVEAEYADTIKEMGEMRKRDEEVAAKKRMDSLEAEELYTSAIAAMREQFNPSFVGLDQLTRGIQLAALKSNEVAKPVEKTNSLLAELKKSHEEAVKIAGEEKTLSETISDSTKKTAERIEKVGTLA